MKNFPSKFWISTIQEFFATQTSRGYFPVYSSCYGRYTLTRDKQSKCHFYEDLVPHRQVKQGSQGEATGAVVFGNTVIGEQYRLDGILNSLPLTYIKLMLGCCRQTSLF